MYTFSLSVSSQKCCPLLHQPLAPNSSASPSLSLPLYVSWSMLSQPARSPPASPPHPPSPRSSCFAPPGVISVFFMGVVCPAVWLQPAPQPPQAPNHSSPSHSAFNHSASGVPADSARRHEIKRSLVITESQVAFGINEVCYVSY